jgi:hypothetical protein
MPEVLPNGKIIPDEAPTPDAATPPQSTSLVNGPIEAAAAKTAAATAEAAEANAVLGNAGGMTGGADVEVKVPGPQMPSGGDGPSFANNYTNAVSTLAQLTASGTGDNLQDKAPETLNPARQGGGSIGRHWSTPSSKFHAAELAKGVKMELEHTDDSRIALEIAKDHLSELPDYYTRLQKMERKALAERRRKTRRAKKAGRRKGRTEKKRSAK